MTKKRTDPHSPSNLNLDDYRYVDDVYLGDYDGMEVPLEWRKANIAFLTWVRQNGVGANFNERGTCDHCGAWFLYGAVYEYLPTGGVIVVGHICAAETFNVGSQADLNYRRMKEVVAGGRERFRRGETLSQYITKHDAPWLEVLRYPYCGWENDFVRDVSNRFYRYGSLSEAQILTVGAAIWRDAFRAVFKRAEEPGAPVIEGRIEIEGRVLAIREQEGFYGWETKWLVRDDRGFKVWGTVPRSLVGDVERDDRVRFTATVEASEDDPTFGFGKRPSKAANLSEEAA